MRRMIPGLPMPLGKILLCVWLIITGILELQLTFLHIILGLIAIAAVSRYSPLPRRFPAPKSAVATFKKRSPNTFLNTAVTIANSYHIRSGCQECWE